MKNNLDERQNQEIHKIAASAFCVMYIISTLSILIQLILLNADFKNIIGETLTLLGGGIVYLVLCIKKGLFLCKGKRLTWMENMIGSILCSGIFSVFYSMTLRKKGNTSIPIGLSAACFFVGITLLCFIVLFIMGKCSAHAEKEKEQKYEE